MRAPAWMLFLGGIAFLGVSAGIALVIISSQNRPALVRSDYYAEGLKLDTHLAAEAVFDSLNITLSLRAESESLIVEVGGPGADDAAVRERLTSLDLLLQLRRPDDPSADRDLSMTLAADRPSVWVAEAPALRRGRWNARAIFSDSATSRLEHAFSLDVPQ